MAETKLSSFADVAEQCRVHPRTLRRWVAIGAFPAPLRIGGTVRFRAADVDAFLRDGSLCESQAGIPSAGFFEIPQDDVEGELATAADLAGDKAD